MFRFKRMILLFLVMILLPFGPARSEQTDTISWRGTIVVRWIHRASWSIPSGAFMLDGMIEEYYTRTITALGDGAASQLIEYSYLDSHEENCGLHVGEYRKEANISYQLPLQQFSMYITENMAIAQISQPSINVEYLFQPACYDGNQYIYEYVDYDASFLSTDDGVFSPDSTEVHGADRYSNYVPSYGGNPGWESSIFVTVYDLTGTERDTPWFSGTTKQALNDSSSLLSKFAAHQAIAGIYNTRKGKLNVAVVNEALSISASTAALIDGLLALDPPDPNYTEITVPVTPTTSIQPVLPGDDLTQAQADAANAVITNLQQDVGLARAILTCVNRASGARAANDPYWTEQQLLASRTYAGQLASVLEARPQLLTNLQQALETTPDLAFHITSQDEAQYKSDLVTLGFSASQQQLLTEMGVDGPAQAQILYAMILTDFPQQAIHQDTIARFPDLFTDPDLIQSTHDLAALLRAYSDGRGWGIFLPVIVR